MAQAPSSEARGRQRLWNPKKERRDEGLWLTGRGERNYLLVGPRASCSDANYGNVSVFSKKKFRSTGVGKSRVSFILSVVGTENLEKFYIGVVATEFCRSQQDFRIDSDYVIPTPQAPPQNSGLAAWLWGQSDSTPAPRQTRRSPGNVLIGKKKRPYNMSMNLAGDVFVCGEQTQQARARRSSARGQVELRIDVENEEVRITSPDLWGQRAVVERITPGEFRLALCCSTGFECDLSTLTPLFTLEDEIPFDHNLEMNDDFKSFARRRCRRIVKKIRHQSNVTPINIVVIGEFGMGKSSLINAIATLFSLRPSDRPKRAAFVTHSTEDQGTRVVRSYVMKDSKFRLVDSIGLAFERNDDTRTLNYEGILADLLKGNINDDFENKNLQQQVHVTGPRWKVTQELTSATEEKEGGIPAGVIADEHLGVEEMNHGALLVASAHGSTDPESSNDIYRRILQFCSDNGGYPTVGVVTHVDIGPDELTPERLYTDPTIGGSFEKARKLLKAPICFPVKCYTSKDNRQNVFHNLLVAEAVDAIFTEALEYKRSVAAMMGVEIVIPEEPDLSSDEEV